jgi:hypothetical protein
MEFCCGAAAAYPYGEADVGWAGYVGVPYAGVTGWLGGGVTGWLGGGVCAYGLVGGVGGCCA